MDMWTIYDHPSDFPDWFIARRSVVGAGGALMTNEVLLADTVESLTRIVENYTGLVMTFISRHESDDPVIVGCLL